jgi:hypothetical protein
MESLSNLDHVGDISCRETTSASVFRMVENMPDIPASPEFRLKWAILKMG